MENFEYIDEYFKGERSPEKQFEFEQRIESDPVFAEDVAFYITAMKASQEEVLKHRRERFRSLSMTDDESAQPVVRTLWPKLVAAAVLVGAVILLFVLTGKDSPEEMASTYMNDQLATMPLQMSSKQSPLQQGIVLYNEKKYQEARNFFDQKIRDSVEVFQSIKAAGLAALQSGNFNQAIGYFTQLEQFREFHANPGKFYHAIALMKRDAEGDREQARQLLEDVIRNDLEGAEEAKKWLPDL